MELLTLALGSLSDAWSLILQPTTLLYLAFGVVMGISIGVFPGLGGIAGLSLMLPFMFGLEPIYGLALMIGLVAVVPTSDTFASVLMGIPGSSSSQATVLDGFPLAKKGQAARALSAAFSSSLFGGIVGAAFLTFFILVARPIVLMFQSPELLMVAIFGVSMVGILAGRVALKGLAAAGLGMMIAMIGEGPFNGEPRLTSYDYPYFLDGLKLVIVGLGIFAVPEIIALLRKGQSINERETLGAGWFEGVKDWWTNKWLSVRSSLLGVAVGVIPGLGGSVVDWIAYGHAVQTTKNKEKFGSGEIRGVIAPESANNAKEGGGLVPTLLFGIPGSGSMAIFIGALALLGQGELEPGQQMLTEDLDVTYAIVWMLALANVLGTILCIALSNPIAQLTNIRFVLIAPFVFMIVSFAAFQSGQNLLDLGALMGIGLIGILLRRFDWSRPAFLIGFVLAKPVEQYSNNAYQISTFRMDQGLHVVLDYLLSPIVWVLIAITLVSVVIGIRQAKNIQAEGDVPTGLKRSPLVFLLTLVVFTAWFMVEMYSIPDYAWVDAVFPVVISTFTFACLLGLLGLMVFRPETDPIFADRELEIDEHHHSFWGTLSWFAGLLVLTALTGFIIALSVFLLCFFIYRARESLPKSLIYSLSGLSFMLFMGWLLNRDFPPGLLQEVVNLPWPLT
ncbi:MAG: tripartite tricarboxylate transporter permease [Pseudomonadota bacterium]|nr:tripartite tricarboxylate transporter permease [Pseudomonadota bacterium]